VAADVRFVLVGGFAVNAWGYLRGTHDIDIVPDPDSENIAKLARALGTVGGRVEVNDRLMSAESVSVFLRSGDRALVVTELGKVDVLQGLPTVPRYAELDKEAQTADLEGLRVRVCSLRHLLAMKRAADRPMDRIDIEALEAGHAEKHPMDSDD
jgi:hypothetical protein